MAKRLKDLKELKIERPPRVKVSDTPYAFKENFETVAVSADKVKTAVNTALEEEAVLITVAKIYHAE